MVNNGIVPLRNSRQTVVLNSLTICNLEGGYFFDNFVNEKGKPKGIIKINMDTHEESAMWCKFIELMSAVTSYDKYPIMTNEDWSLTIDYSIWSSPIYFQERCLDNIRITFTSEGGKITTDSFLLTENSQNSLIGIDGSKGEEFCDLPNSVVEDFANMNFYRFFPRDGEENLDCVMDLKNYFLDVHDINYAKFNSDYRDELDAVLNFAFPSFKVNIEFKYYSSQEGRNYYNHLFFKEDPNKEEDRGIILNNMPNDFQAFFLFYSELKQYKDGITEGVLGLYCDDSSYNRLLDIYVECMHYSSDNEAFQFFIFKKP